MVSYDQLSSKASGFKGIEKMMDLFLIVSNQQFLIEQLWAGGKA